MIRNKETLSFDISDSSVKLIYNKQVIVFNQYNCPSRHKFNRFKQTIANSPKARYDNINDIIGLATRHQIRGTHGSYMTVHKNIAF